MEGQRGEHEDEREGGWPGRQVGSEGRMSVVRRFVAWGTLGLAVGGCLPARSEPPPPARSPGQVGVASWYGDDFQGSHTASGEQFDANAMTAAHPSLPLGTRLRVINLANGRSVVVRVTDRGPFVCGRMIDVSTADVSSTTIRARVAAGDSIAGLVPPGVQHHIEQHGLYTSMTPGRRASDAPRPPAAGRLHG